MMRSPADCQYILAGIVECNPNQLSCLIGMLGGVYLKYPDAQFWDVLIKFQQDKRNAMIVNPNNT